MLHRSFKPAKCKTSLKLAASRIKLLKNKKEAQVKQLKRELAQLLEAGQDQTARIRVEHVVREEKMMAAYDLIEIYSELIVARLPIIESQKNCPIDLKEAVASLIFATPRCADVPELMDVRKHFTAKYGKEFVSAAVELRPDCGVSRLMVEKLSAKAPDGPTKVKILSAIAEEHNVKWDPKAFGGEDIKPPEDLLNGPTTFEQASKMPVQSPDAQQPPNTVDKGPPNFQDFSKYEKHDAKTDSYYPHPKSSPHSQTSTDTDASKSSRPVGAGAEGVDSEHPYAGDESGFSLGRQSWNMEFKDATAAAQAAAESAERASMAARAAAELSSQGRSPRQHTTESRTASAFSSRDEGPPYHTGSKLQGKHLAKDPINNTSLKRNSGKHHVQIDDGNEQDDLAGLTERFYNLKSSNKSSLSTSLESSSASVDAHPSVDDLQMANRHSQKSSSGLEKRDILCEATVKKQSIESEVDFVNKIEDGMKSEPVDHLEKASIRKQSGDVSSWSHLQTLSDDYNVFFNKPDWEPDADPFANDEEKIPRNAKETTSSGNSTRIFDDSGSDDDVGFDVESEHNKEESTSYFFSSEGRKSSHMVANTDTWSPQQNTDESLGKSSSQFLFAPEQHSSRVFTEAPMSDTVPPQHDDSLPMTFDDSDGPSSDNEEEGGKSSLVGSTSTDVFPHEVSVYSRKPEPIPAEKPHFVRSSLAEKEGLASKSKTRLHPSLPDSDVAVVRSDRKQEIEVNAEAEGRSGYGNLYTTQLSSRTLKSQSDPNDFNDNLQSSAGNSYAKPSSRSVKSRSNSNDLKANLQSLEVLSSEDDVQTRNSPVSVEDVKPIEESSVETGKELNFGILTGGLRNKGYRHPPYCRSSSGKSSTSKQAVEDMPSKIEESSSSPTAEIDSGAHNHEPYNEIMQPKLNKKTSSGTSVAYSYPDNDSDEELPQQNFSSSQASYTQKSVAEVSKKNLSTYFGSDDSDSEEELQKSTPTSQTYSSAGFSRRTKISPVSSKDLYSKATVPSESSVRADHIVERKLSSSSSYAAETQPKSRSRTKSSELQGSSESWKLEGRKSAEQPASKVIPQSKRSSHEEVLTPGSSDFWKLEGRKSAEQPASKVIPQSKRSSHEEPSTRNSYSTDTRQNQSHSKSSDSWSHSQRAGSGQAASKPSPEFKRSSREGSLMPSARKQPPANPPPVKVASGPTGSSKTFNLQGETPSRENSLSKASHVHPKLPDYDSITAHLRSLRENRQ